jgi:hypothetical protein
MKVARYSDAALMRSTASVPFRNGGRLARTSKTRTPLLNELTGHDLDLVNLRLLEPVHESEIVPSYVSLIAVLAHPMLP